MTITQGIVVGAPTKVSVFDPVLASADVVDGFGVGDRESGKPVKEGSDLGLAIAAYRSRSLGQEGETWDVVNGYRHGHDVAGLRKILAGPVWRLIGNTR